MAVVYSWDDTIVALATPPGVGAIGVIRISGPLSFDITNQLFPSKDITLQQSHTIHVGYLKHNNDVLDEVVISLFRNPRSYTGEDVVEISCHGSPYIQQQIIDVILLSGARLARPGEFTLRAYLNGKIDLTQAEAVADLIASGTKASRDNALHAMRGGFSKVLADLREQMIKFSALIELELDFSQEDVEFADRTQFYALLRNASAITHSLMESFAYGNVIKNGVRVAIVGKPNAGKSTLLNNLLNENRAIVSDIAGTTRDTIEEVLNIKGILFRLIDTAGIREHTADIIEQVGMQKTFQKIQEAEIVLYVFDVQQTSVEELEEFLQQVKHIPVLLIANKIDIIGEQHAREKFNALNSSNVNNNIDKSTSSSDDVLAVQSSISAAHQTVEINQPLERNKAIDHNESYPSNEPIHPISHPIIFTSARNDNQLEQLKETLFSLSVTGSSSGSDTIITNARHYEALRLVHSSIQDIINGLDNNLPGDLLSLDIRRCLSYLSDITGGDITTEDQLDYIFSKFCIGK